jgi:LCP family protein required for cell wall assembly
MRAESEADAWQSRGPSADRIRGVSASGAARGGVNRDVGPGDIASAGRAARTAGGRARGSGRGTRRRKILTWTAIGVSTTLVVMLGVGAYVVMHLTGNIRHTALLQNGVTQSPEPTDPFGRSPMNILIIGSDSRSNPADCKIGGDCGPGANADVEMVVHLSADRSNATVMSVPRDTVMTLPQCTDPTTKVSGGGFTATINTSLQWGPSCTVSAVHNLTGLTIDHFVMVDFVGVEALSNALGGVQVCVSAKMYDPNSGLRLNAGQNMVQGLSALQFVRSRHGFYDGSDLGREKAQHYFLSAMIREVRANLNLADFGTLYKIANAATAALTVDDGLSGISNLEGLATTMNKIPTDRISFVTMPWNLDPSNQSRVVAAQPYADTMFHNIGNDVAYSKGPAPAPSGAGTPSAAGPATTTQPAQSVASPSVAVDKAQVRVQVFNASGTSGRASTVRSALESDGFPQASVGGSASSTPTTVVYYPSSRADSAATVANSLGLPASALKQSNSYYQVTVVVGSDFGSGSTYGDSAGSGGSGSAAAPSTAASAPEVSSLENASTTNGCVTVNPFYIVK